MVAELQASRQLRRQLHVSFLATNSNQLEPQIGWAAIHRDDSGEQLNLPNAAAACQT